MKTITEATRSVDVVLDTDVLVIGSGPGGLAMCARRRARRCAHGVD
jgi:cation diffusion facilitator CzcD-associated flavoprotein CzcO